MNDKRAFSLFMGYGDETTETVLELTYNWDTASYDIGTGYGHVAISVPDVYKTCDDIRSKGGRIIREPGPMKHGKTVIAFIEDPDGYQLELIER